RRHERLRPGGEDEHVVGLLDAVGVDDLPLAIDARDPLAGVEGDVVLLVPRERVEEDFLRVLRPVEHVGEQDAVVVAVRLVAEHHDVEPVAAEGEDVLDEPGAGHAVADHDQPLAGARGGREGVRDDHAEAPCVAGTAAASPSSFDRRRTASPTTITAGAGTFAARTSAASCDSGLSTTTWFGSVAFATTAAGVSGGIPAALSRSQIFSICRSPM